MTHLWTILILFRNYVDTLVLLLFQFRPPALVYPMTNKYSFIATVTSTLFFLSNFIIDTFFFVTFVRASSHFSFLSILLLSLPLILIISHSLIKCCSFYVFYTNTQVLENCSKFFIPIENLTHPELKLLAKQLFYKREEMTLIQVVGLYVIMLLSWFLSNSKSGIWWLTGMIVGIQCLTQIPFIEKQISRISTPLFEKHILSKFTFLALIFPDSYSDLEHQEQEFIQQVEQLKNITKEQQATAVTNQNSTKLTTSSQPLSSINKEEVKTPVGILKKPLSTTNSSSLSIKKEKSVKTNLESNSSEEQKSSTSTTKTNQRVPSMRFKTSSLAKMLKQSQQQVESSSLTLTANSSSDLTNTTTTGTETTEESRNGSGVAIVGIIGERLKQKLQLRTPSSSSLSKGSDASVTNASQDNNTSLVMNEGNSMVVKKAKISKPRREKTRTNVSSLLNDVIQAANDQHDIELPDQNEFDKLEEISKLEKKLGAVGALATIQHHKKDQENNNTKEQQENSTSASSVIGKMGARTATTSTSSLLLTDTNQEAEHVKPNQPKGGVAVGGGVSLKDILAARNKLNKTGENLK